MVLYPFRPLYHTPPLREEARAAARCQDTPSPLQLACHKYLVSGHIGGLEAKIGGRRHYGCDECGESAFVIFGRKCGCLEAGGLATIHRAMANRSYCRWNDRVGPRRAPKCPSFEPSFLGGSNTSLAPFFNILNCLMQFFAQASSPAPVWCRGYPKMLVGS